MGREHGDQTNSEQIMIVHYEGADGIDYPNRVVLYDCLPYCCILHGYSLQRRLAGTPYGSALACRSVAIS
jgi:hypothetical protein